MGIDKLSTVYGRIIISGGLEEAKETINNLNFGKSYPYLQKEMFNTGWAKNPWHYESQIIGFSANYKRAEDHWNSFILKFEYLIEELNYFESAQINLETFYFGTYNYKWSKKENFVIGRNGKERNDWTFTIGHEGNYVNYEEKLLKNEIFDIGFVYPIVFKESFYKPIKK